MTEIEENWDPTRNWTMVPLRQILIWERFAPYSQTMLQLRLHMINKPALEKWFFKNPIPIFVSHRWDTPEAPDPTGRQAHIVIRFLVEAICLSLGICERFFSYAEPEIVLNPELRDRIRQHPVDYMRNMYDMQDYQRRHWKSPFGPPMPFLLSGWFQSNFPALHVETEEIIAISDILRDIVVWYDYTSLPQRPYASETEERYFQWGLRHLEHLIPTTHVVVIWDKPAIKRGWCLYEGLVAESLQNASYDASPNTNWGTALFDVDEKYQRQHPNRQMSQYTRDFGQTISGMDCDEIVDYFRAQEIQCTKEEDLAIVAENLHRFLNQS